MHHHQGGTQTESTEDVLGNQETIQEWSKCLHLHTGVVEYRGSKNGTAALLLDG